MYKRRKGLAQHQKYDCTNVEKNVNLVVRIVFLKLKEKKTLNSTW